MSSPAQAVVEIDSLTLRCSQSESDRTEPHRYGDRMDDGNPGATAVVVADRRGRAASLATAVLVERLSTRHRVTVVDLDGFGVAMTGAERRAYESDEPILDAGVRSSAEAVARAAVLAFVTPLQSSGLSAPVKGWLDRVLVPGVGFEIGDDGRMRPGLGHVRRLITVTVDDRSRLRRLREGNSARRVISRALRLVCGWSTRSSWIRVGSEASAAEISDAVTGAARRW